MTITLSARTENLLRERTAHSRQSMDALADSLLAEALKAYQRDLVASFDKWNRFADALSEGIHTGIEPLSDYAVSRESIYEDRF